MQPIFNNIIVSYKKEDVEKISEGGIIFVSKIQNMNTKIKVNVVAIGNDCKVIKPNTCVLIDKYCASEIEENEKEILYLVKEENILAIID